jgi:hypothetical protein
MKFSLYASVFILVMNVFLLLNFGPPMIIALFMFGASLLLVLKGLTEYVLGIYDEQV